MRSLSARNWSPLGLHLDPILVEPTDEIGVPIQHTLHGRGHRVNAGLLVPEGVQEVDEPLVPVRSVRQNVIHVADEQSPVASRFHSALTVAVLP